MGHKRVLLLAHGKKAEKPEFKAAYAWLEKDGHDIDMIKTGSPEDMSKGVKKMITHFDGTPCQSRPLLHLDACSSFTKKHFSSCLYPHPLPVPAHRVPPEVQHIQCTVCTVSCFCACLPLMHMDALAHCILPSAVRHCFPFHHTQMHTTCHVFTCLWPCRLRHPDGCGRGWHNQPSRERACGSGRTQRDMLSCHSLGHSQ